MIELVPNDKISIWYVDGVNLWMVPVTSSDRTSCSSVIITEVISELIRARGEETFVI